MKTFASPDLVNLPSAIRGCKMTKYLSNAMVTSVNTDACSATHDSVDDVKNLQQKSAAV